MKTLVELEGLHERSVIALAFSADGNLLASVGTDDHKTIGIYDWQKKKLVAHTQGSSSEILVIKFLPKSNTELVTCGEKHVRFWKLEGDKLSYKGTEGISYFLIG